jgi:2-phosphoglycolate phosphatase
MPARFELERFPFPPVTDSKEPLPLLPERIRALIFDLDGTLVDSYGAIASSLNRARAAFRLPPLTESEVRGEVGWGLEALMARSLGDERADEGVRIFREHYETVFLALTHLLPGAAETVEALRERGYRLSVASNKPARFGTRILRNLGLLDHIDEVQGPDRCGAAKPDPTMIRLCLRSMAVEAHEAVYIGDMVLDVETAARAGLPVLLCRGGSSPEDELHKTGERVLNSLPGILSLLPPRPGRGGYARARGTDLGPLTDS